MSFIPNDNAARVREAANIIDIIGRYVSLEKSGNKYKALCPFHQEKTPSFHVDPDTGLYYCFGCQQGGDVFSFLMSIEGWSFPEALKYLGDEYGISIAKSSSPQDNYKDKLYKLNEYVMRIFQKQLSDRKGTAARTYLAERGFSKDIIELAGLGWADDGWDNLINIMSDKQVPLKMLVDTGLAGVANNNNSMSAKYYDKFRSRIVFPIKDILGRIIGFGGRIIGDGQPKYLNSPETVLYQKSRSLYGIYNARSSIKDTKVAIIMEGYLDVLAAWQAGFKNTVASLGTAFTIDQAKLLKRYAEKCIICYDGDPAGIKAAQKGINVLRQVDLEVKIAVLPSGLDPDDYLKEYGSEAFANELNHKSLNAFEYLVQVAEKKYNLSRQEEKLRFASELVSLLATVENHIEKAGYIAGYAEKYNLDKKALELEILRFINNSSSTNNKVVRYSTKDKATQDNDSIITKVIKKERKLLRLLIESRHEVECDIFSSTNHKHIYSMIIASEWDNPRDLVALCKTDDEKQILANILMDEVSSETEMQLIQQLKNFSLDRKIAELRRNIKEKVSLGENPNSLLLEFSKLERRRAHLHQEDDLV